jgi:hypothetical protein
MDHYGDNFRWFIGVVVNNLDPLELGRVQVRIFGTHSREQLNIPNNTLPWATVASPTISGGTSGIGPMPQLLPGAQVVGFFMDGKGSQLPLVIGSIPHIHIPSEQQLERMQKYSIGYGVGQVDPALARAAGLTTQGTSSPPNTLGSAANGAGLSSSANYAMTYFVSRGWTPAQAAGIVGNLQAESGKNLSLTAVGDGGKALGIAQWHPNRRIVYERTFGKPWSETTFEDQLGFIQWELNNFDNVSGNLNKNAGTAIRNSNTAAQAATIFDAQYERSSGAHRQKRIDNAEALLEQWTLTSAGAG